MNLTLLWVRGLLARRPGRIAATAIGVAIAVSLLASIGAFLSGSTAAMTERAIAGVPLDWQVQAQAGADPGALLAAVRNHPGVKQALPVAYAQTAGYSATVGGTTNTASAGLAIGLPDGYRSTYPGELRQFVGATSGVLVAQQMAANLGVTTGGTITVRRAGLAPVRLNVDGIVDFPAAARFLGPIGAGTAATAPPVPDNVILLPAAQWHTLFDPLAAARPDLVRAQVHAELNHASLPRDPTAAFVRVEGLARNLETKLSGTGSVGDNLAFALDKARGDSLYARLAFLFLGLPGALIAGLVTASIASAGSDRRRRDQGLLRARGATTATLVRIASVEAALVAVVGGVVGLGAALVIGRTAFGSASFGAGVSGALTWSIGAFVVGVIIAALAIVLPAWRDARSLTVAAARQTVGRARSPWWMRYGLDLIALVAAGLVFWGSGSNGYHLVLATEGTPQVSVNYWSFLAPLLAWIGIGLFAWRLAELALGRGGRGLAGLLRPLTGELSGTVAASMNRQRRPIARALALVTLTTCFAASTAAFNSTYKQQAEVDARLSNGADVVVTQPRGSRVGADLATTLAKVPGVLSAEPMLHRYAYIGRDLQDLYAVNATTVARNAQLQDAFFTGATANALMAKLAATPDGVIVSQEVVTDYQLKPGDHIALRLLDQRTRKEITTQFTYIGITKEFPTAPKDAYLITNSNYVAHATGDPGIGTVLIQTNGTSPAVVGQRVAKVVGTNATVTDINTDRKLISGSLTSVELAGLTRVELAYALILAAAATGLLLWLGLAERRRTFAIAKALGAKDRQLAGFVWSETAFVTGGGVVLGAAGATALAWMLVKLLTGVFDPPPTGPVVPWAYLVGLAAVTLVAVTSASWAAARSVRRPAIESLRDL